MKEQQPAKGRRGNLGPYAQALAQIIAWPLIILIVIPAGVFTYLVIISGADAATIRSTVVGWVEFVVVAHVVGLLLIGAANGFRSLGFKISIAVSVALIILSFGLAFLGFLQPR